MKAKLLLCCLICLGLLETISAWYRPGRASVLRSLSHGKPLSMLNDGAPIVRSSSGVHSVSVEVAGKTISFETGKIGRQANGAVVARMADTMVYSTLCFERHTAPMDFAPLRVDYFARYSAVGQTCGAFHRRDSRGDDLEIISARLIDRSLRPVMPEGWQHETQALSWLLSYDKRHSPEALTICGASAAMAISELPMASTVAALTVGLVDGQFVVNPTNEEMRASPLHLTVAGTKTAILMIEGTAAFLTEEQMISALSLGQGAIAQICDAISMLQQVAGKEKKTDTLRSLPKHLLTNMDRMFGDRVLQALSVGAKQSRGQAVGDVEAEITKRFVTDNQPASIERLSNPLDALVELQEEEDGEGTGMYANEPTVADVVQDIINEEEASEINSNGIDRVCLESVAGYGYDPLDVKVATKKLLVRKLRQLVLTTGFRTDGRNTEEVRPISIETNILPNAHGSALFTRGETQALATATLGSKNMEARFESVDEIGAKRFYLQYRFPPSSVGEVGRVGGVNRREVGHGNLAERALLPALPDETDFPYSIRAESLITESCGSSSMATVCGCCLAMLDAGVPLKTSVAGVAMGLVQGESEADEPVILTDILGLEDALGTMDFKVAGNASGITTFQLDIKSQGVEISTLRDALAQAKRGRLHILRAMDVALSEAAEIKSHIPRLLSFTIPQESIGKVIGPKGKTLQGLIDMFGLKDISVASDKGLLQISSFSDQRNADCKETILKLISEPDANARRGSRIPDEVKKLVLGPPPEEGTIYRNCTISSVHSYGVFVEIIPGYEGLVHVSELELKRVPSVEKSYAVGQQIDVKFIGKNDKGQTVLSRKAVLMRDGSNIVFHRDQLPKG